MDLRFSQEDEAFRTEVRDWLESRLSGAFASLRGRGGPGDEHACYDERRVWERELAAGGYTCLGWPRAYGGQDASLMREVIFQEEYARARGPGRLNHIGETLAGPTIIAFGTEEQKQRFLPPIVATSELWCQGYSEPNAGSDLANVQTRAELVDGRWVINGQKVWTSLAQWSDWSFVVCRTHPTEPRHRGLSYLLVPMNQPGVEIRPIRQLGGTAEFNEVFFDNATTDEGNLVGELHGGWKVAMGTLAFERGASTLSQQLQFENELRELIAIARRNGSAEDPAIRQRLSNAWIGLRVMRLNGLRLLSDATGTGRVGAISKLYWATWHRELGKLAMDILGAQAEVADGHEDLTSLQRMFLFTRSDTIYAGSNEIQRNIIAERSLGLPRG